MHPVQARSIVPFLAAWSARRSPVASDSAANASPESGEHACPCSAAGTVPQDSDRLATVTTARVLVAAEVVAAALGLVERSGVAPPGQTAAGRSAAASQRVALGCWVPLDALARGRERVEVDQLVDAWGFLPQQPFSFQLCLERQQRHLCHLQRSWLPLSCLRLWLPLCRRPSLRRLDRGMP